MGWGGWCLRKTFSTRHCSSMSGFQKRPEESVPRISRQLLLAPRVCRSSALRIPLTRDQSSCLRGGSSSRARLGGAAQTPALDARPSKAPLLGGQGPPLRAPASRAERGGAGCAGAGHGSDAGGGCGSPLSLGCAQAPPAEGPAQAQGGAVVARTSRSPASEAAGPGAGAAAAESGERGEGAGRGRGRRPLCAAPLPREWRSGRASRRPRRPGARSPPTPPAPPSPPPRATFDGSDLGRPLPA